MVRAPCCEKMGLKKGPWTPEEDRILISYIHKNGHANWRALPKHAGLLRCGKSCRLRWTNYLRPDIKRGNFTKEEEDTIINLHEMLGNRWSTIAARLPGRTDNEIKNVWHTHLKKKLKDYQPKHNAPHKKTLNTKPESSNVTKIQHVVTSPVCAPPSPHVTSSETSSLSDLVTTNLESSYCRNKPQRNSSEDCSFEMVTKHEDNVDSPKYFPQIDESFWTEDVTNFPWVAPEELETFESPNSLEKYTENEGHSKMDEDMDFWFNIFIRAGDLPELPNF